jgi:hypothetical protein
VLDESQFEELFGTPQQADAREVAAAFGWPVDDIGDGDGDGDGGGAGVGNGTAAFEDALHRRVGDGGRSVIRVRLPGRADNVAVHQRVEEAVVVAVDPAGNSCQQGRGS